MKPVANKNRELKKILTPYREQLIASKLRAIDWNIMEGRLYTLFNRLEEGKT